MVPFLLVKVLDRQWAEKLLDGQIFMRPLSEFSDRVDAGTANAFRGDLLEGLGSSYSSKQESTLFREALAGEQTAPIGMGLFAANLQQEKIYSMYALEYSERLGAFVAPDRRLLDFGDTAIIIVDTLTFMRRLVDTLRRDYEDTLWFGAKRVDYTVDLTKSATYDEFTKASSYSWQNEYRIAVDLNDGCVDQKTWDRMTDFARLMYLNQGGRVHRGSERAPITLEIGDIRDASVLVPTIDLVDLKLPMDRLRSIAVPPSMVRPRRPVATAFTPIIQWEA
jgi:hypothetical protein